MRSFAAAADIRRFGLSRGRDFSGFSAPRAELDPGEEIGVAILAGLSITGIHSSINPSFSTLRAFAADGPNKREAATGLWIGLGLSTVASAAIWIVFDSLLSAVVAEATAVALFGIGMYALNAPVAQVPAPAVAPPA